MTEMNRYCAISLSEKLAKFRDHWAPRVIAELNDYQLKLVKFQGDFVWHRHDDTDEVFLVINGEMEIEFRDGAVTLAAGDRRLPIFPKTALLGPAPNGPRLQHHLRAA